MIALDASKILVMSAVLMVVDLRRQVGERGGGQADLAVGAHAVGNFGAAEIEPDHHRRDEGEFDRRNAAPVAPRSAGGPAACEE